MGHHMTGSHKRERSYHYVQIRLFFQKIVVENFNENLNNSKHFLVQKTSKEKFK